MNWGSTIALLAGVARLGAAILEYLNLPVRRRAVAEQVSEREAAAERARVDADEKAVREGDKDQVNKRLKELLPAVLAGCLLLSGCATRTVYVPDDREVVPIEHDGRAGWFVPNARMQDMLQAAQRARDLEREMAVRARMEGK